MNFNFSSILLIISLFIDTCSSSCYKIFKDEYNFPGSPMQFNITVTESLIPLNYQFDLTDNITNSTFSIYDTNWITKTYIFPNNTKPGIYRLDVQVFLNIILMKVKINPCDKNYVDFEIRNRLNGIIKYNQENLRESAYKHNLVSCFNKINFISQIDDFHHFYDNIKYDWFINGTYVSNITDKQLNHTFQTESYFNITTTFIAKAKTGLISPGQNELIIKSYKALDNLKTTGIPIISWKRSKGLEIYVNFINGTKPFWYCYQIFSNNNTKLICDDPTETFEDYFKVSKRFSRNGTYYLKIKAGNIVTELEKSFPISVIDFEKKSQIIFFIMPAVAFSLIIFILIIGILYYMNKRKKFMTEIADFNFETKSQAECEVSLFERIKNIFVTSIRHELAQIKMIKFNRFNRLGGYTNNLINEDT